MNIKSLSDLKDHIRRIEDEDKIMQANLEANLHDIKSRINFKSIVEQILNEAKGDRTFVRKAALAGAVLLVNHLPIKFGGTRSGNNILSAILSLVPASQVALAGGQVANQLLRWIQKLKEKRAKKSESTITDSY